MKASINYSKYINEVNNCLSVHGVRRLTSDEQSIVIEHLRQVVEAYPEKDVGGLNLLETLALEAGKTACELHPDMPNPSPETVTDAIFAILDEG